MPRLESPSYFPPFPRIMEVTAAAFAMLGEVSAGVVCEALNFLLKAQVLGFAGRRFLVT